MPGEVPEHLILRGADYSDIGDVAAVDRRGEGHLQSSLVVGEVPRLHQIGFASLAGDAEVDVVQLVRSAVDKEHVLRRLRGVAEAVPQIEADRAAVFGAVLHRAPIPSVGVGPNSAPPIECAQRLGRVEDGHLVADLVVAARRHAIDLGVVVEREVVAGEGRRDDHRVARRLRESDLGEEILAVLEVLALRLYAPRLAVVAHGDRDVAALEAHVPLVEVGREVVLAEREGRDARLCDKVFLLQVDQTYARQGEIADVGQRERQRALAVRDEIVVPLLDAPLARLDVVAAVRPGIFRGIARLQQLALIVQKSALSQNVLHDITSRQLYNISSDL